MSYIGHDIGQFSTGRMEGNVMYVHQNVPCLKFDGLKNAIVLTNQEYEAMNRIFSSAQSSLDCLDEKDNVDKCAINLCKKWFGE